MAQATDTTVQVAPKLTPEQRAKEDLAFDAKIRAVDAQAELDAQKAMELAGANEVRNRQLEAQRKQDAAEAAAIQQETAEAQKRFEAAMADRKAFEQTQPKQMGIGEGILSAIAAGLGAFGSGMTGGPNQALSIINRAADKRVADWERELAGKKGNVDLSQNALAYFRSKGMDSKAAAAAARATLLDKAAEKIDYIASGYKGPEFLQRAETLKAGLVEQRIQSDNQQALNEQNKIVKRYTSAPAQGMDPRDQRAQRELEVEVPKLGADGKTEGITTFYAKSASEGKAIRDAQKVASGIRSDLQLMEALIAGSPTMNPETRQKVETLNNSIRKKYIKLDELGVPTGKDLELSSVVGDPRAWTQRTSQTRDLINRSRQDVANRLLQSYEVQGYRE